MPEPVNRNARAEIGCTQRLPSSLPAQPQVREKTLLLANKQHSASGGAMPRDLTPTIY